MHQIPLYLLLPTLFAHQCGLPPFMGIDSDYPAPDPSCIFNDSLITRENLKRFPKDCTTVCANITFDSTSGFTEKEVNGTFSTLRILFGILKIEGTNFKILNFFSSLQVIFYGIIIINNPKLTNITAFKRWSPYEEFTTHVFGNSALDFEPFCDRDWDRLYTDFNVYGNLKNCVLKVYNTQLEDLSFLKNLEVIYADFGFRFLSIMDNPNLKRLGFESLKTILPENNTFAIEIKSNHPDFCITTNELQVLAVHNVDFIMAQLKLCDDLNRKDGEKVCHFGDLSTMDSDCQHIIGDVVINDENEKFVEKLKNVSFIYGSLTIKDTEELENLDFLSNFRQVANLKIENEVYGEWPNIVPQFDQTPMIRIISNEKLQKVWLHNMRSICPSGFKKTNDKCLKLHTKSLKHLEAEQECSQFGGTLATIKNAVDNRAIYNLAASAGVNSIWIGLFCYANGNSTLCIHDDDSGPMIFTNFKFGNPNLQGNNGCVFMWTSGQRPGEWVTSSCGVVGMPFVCEAPLTLSDSTCKHNYNGYCYLPSHELNLSENGTYNSTYSEASAICASYNATLASIHSKPEVDYIHALFKNSGAPGLILGALPADGFYWNDGSNWDYNNVNPLDKSNTSCLLMDLATEPNYGLWSKTDCHSRNQFLCKRRISQEKVPEKANEVWTMRVDLPVYIYDEHDNLIGMAGFDISPFEFLAPGNVVKVVHDSKDDAANGHHGFNATILPF
ncbi:hypothetical protein B9Z55_018373 [Caenorhabditis nigoni]|uniref:C-type lectin domain-containing protein n=1 Tax=Caenorhabditis nigoni TaxID=1611254 RepID=A0A2G5TEE6_9PELO|nr:hypothetical protein B9Z55_018373 [Caenorhabditis nigoni]